jgi:hypothetical protein
VPKKKAKAGTKRGRGQPTKLTPELQKQICDYIRKGRFVENAAARFAIDKKTIYNWRNKGKELSAKGESGPEVDFFHAINRALTDAEDRFLGWIEEHAKKRKKITKKVVQKPDGHNADGSVRYKIETTITEEEIWGDWKPAAWHLERGPYGGKWRAPVPKPIEEDGEDNEQEKVERLRRILEAMDMDTLPPPKDVKGNGGGNGHARGNGSGNNGGNGHGNGRKR